MVSAVRPATGYLTVNADFTPVLYTCLGAKYKKKNRSVAPPRKKNSIAIMHQVYISGAWKTMFD